MSNSSIKILLIEDNPGDAPSSVLCLSLRGAQATWQSHLPPVILSIAKNTVGMGNDMMRLLRLRLAMTTGKKTDDCPLLTIDCRLSLDEGVIR